MLSTAIQTKLFLQYKKQDTNPESLDTLHYLSERFAIGTDKELQLEEDI